MQQTVSFKSFFILCLSCITLSSCACVPVTSKLALRSGSREALKEGRALLARSAHIQAVALLADAYKNCRNREVLDLYHEAARRAGTAGDQAYSRKEYAKAGLLYRALKTNSILDTEKGVLTVDQDYLEKQINECSKMLAEQGLKEYRAENLRAAIAAWEQVLQFDPNNREVVNALDTANRQQVRFQSIK